MMIGAAGVVSDLTYSCGDSVTVLLLEKSLAKAGYLYFHGEFIHTMFMSIATFPLGRCAAEGMPLKAWKGWCGEEHTSQVMTPCLTKLEHSVWLAKKITFRTCWREVVNF